MTTVTGGAGTTTGPLGAHIFPGPGWATIHLTEMVVYRLDLPSASGLTPSVTIRRGGVAWKDGIRDDPRGPSSEGTLLARDRWLGDRWFGWRFLSLVPLPGGLTAPVARWFLWPVRASGGVDPDRDLPILDVAFSCTLRAYPLARGMADSLVSAIPADWAPGAPGSAPLALRHKPEEAASPHPWGHLPLTEVEAELTAAPPAGSAQDLIRLEFLTDTGELTDRGRQAARIMADPDGICTLSMWSARGFAEPLRVHRGGPTGLVQVQCPVAGEEPRRTPAEEAIVAGLAPIEYVAETVTALVGLTGTDTVAFEVESLEPTLLVDRSLDPTIPPPADLAADPRWTAAWNEPWTLWRLSAAQRDELTDSSGERAHRVDLVVLSLGSVGHYRVFRDEHAEDRVVLTPWSGSEVLVSILDQLGGLPVGVGGPGL